jgi:hypothetical protein
MAVSILTRGADMLGHLEWLIADLKKKGAPTKADEVDGLSDRLDLIFARLEGRDAYGGNEGGAVGKGRSGAPSEGVSGPSTGLLEFVDQIDEQIRHMTREDAVCTREDIERLSQLLNALEAEVGEKDTVSHPKSKE